MKKILIVLSTVVFTLFSGCSKWAGDPVTKAFSVGDAYIELDVEDAFDVYVSDTATQITITVGENIMPHVKVVNADNKLSIYLKGWTTNRGSDMKVILPYNAELRRIGLHGASEFHTDFTIVAEEVEIELTGASDFYGNIEAGDIEMDLSGASSFSGHVSTHEMDLDMSGSSDAALEGQVDYLDMDLSGASTIKNIVVDNHYALVCDRCNGSMSGSSDAYLHSDGTITVTLSGGSDLYYTGSANTRGSSMSGSSEIIHNEF